ncbi:MAG TPA: YdeI/OmpD-associated family protein [Allosphingosinicella sp.]|jgi:uncharacterized protein YdeI (YjbR/CyaY-like superfamily)
MKRDERIDAYIARQAEFAQPILEHLRAAVHDACPDCEETLKWSAPAFLYMGKQLAMMAAFKQHATFSFWRGSLVVGEEEARDGAMGQFGRLTSIADLPAPDALAEMIRKAMALTDAGVKPQRSKSVKDPLDVPDDLRGALEDNAAAAATFDGFGPGARREYVEWITTAKQQATREKRLAQTVEWLAEGKKRNWKYEKC